jgi:hypothetical protein
MQPNDVTIVAFLQSIVHAQSVYKTICTAYHFDHPARCDDQACSAPTSLVDKRKDGTCQAIASGDAQFDRSCGSMNATRSRVPKRARD